MAESKKSPSPPAPVQSTPENEANARISELQNQVAAVERELRILRGRVSNQDPGLAKELKADNEKLRMRVALLEKALYALVRDALKARNEEEAQQSYEVLRQTVV